MGKYEKRPALLGEVGGGRALATTRLYPALFSTVEAAWGFCMLWLGSGVLTALHKALKIGCIRFGG
jgi:hypothetical protein